MLQPALPSTSKSFSVKEHSLPDTYRNLQDPELPANHRQQADLGHHLIVSPYTTLPHLLDLGTLEEPQRLLAKSLTLLQSTREDYATAPYHQSFNWDAVTDQLKSLLEFSAYKWKHQHFYIVVFRSQIPPTTDRTHLIELDQRSHAEATKSGGLLKYWFGLPDENGRNLATCIWRHSADARPASVGPGHKEAMRETRDMYTEWKLERLKFEIDDDARGWRITPWED